MPETFITIHTPIHYIPISTWASLNCFLQTCLPRNEQLLLTDLTRRLSLMLNIARRGPASTIPSLLSRSIPLRCIRTAQARDVQQCIPRGTYAIAPRPFSTSTKWRQFAAAATAHEDEAIQSEDPPNAQTRQPTNYGPVTKFKELAERGMVSETVIDTLTRQMGLETMTHVQALTINEILKGQDV